MRVAAGHEMVRKSTAREWSGKYKCLLSKDGGESVRLVFVPQADRLLAQLHLYVRVRLQQEVTSALNCCQATSLKHDSQLYLVSCFMKAVRGKGIQQMGCPVEPDLIAMV